MDNRERVRQFLLGGDTDRAPFLPFVTELIARLAQVEPRSLYSDANLLTQSFLEAAAVCHLECLVLVLPVEAMCAAVDLPDPLANEVIAVSREGLRRLRTLLGGQSGIALVLPGPLTLAQSLKREASSQQLEDLSLGLLRIAQVLEPPLLDVLGVLEKASVPIGVEPELDRALSAFWNSARYYSIPSLFVGAQGGPAIGRFGASSVAVWDGATVPELVASGANRAGVPVELDPVELPHRPAPGFYVTRGEIPPETDIAKLQELALLVQSQ